MKKNFEKKDPQEQPAEEPDVLGLLKKIQQHMVFLERKIDTLMGKSVGGSFNKEQRFQQRPRPFGNSFRQDRGNFRQDRGNFRQGQGRGNFRPEHRSGGQDRPYDKPQGNEERNFNRQPDSEGERSFRGKGRFSHRHRGPKRHF